MGDAAVQGTEDLGMHLKLRVAVDPFWVVVEDQFALLRLTIVTEHQLGSDRSIKQNTRELERRTGRVRLKEADVGWLE